MTGIREATRVCQVSLPSFELNALPREAPYVSLARSIVAATESEQKARDRKINYKRECAKAMHAVRMTYFTFYEFAQDRKGKVNRLFKLTLERPKAERINVRKLYVMLQNGDLTMDEFFDCIVAPIKMVEEQLGEEIAKSLTETYEKGLDIVIEEVVT